MNRFEVYFTNNNKSMKMVVTAANRMKARLIVSKLCYNVTGCKSVSSLLY